MPVISGGDRPRIACTIDLAASASKKPISVAAPLAKPVVFTTAQMKDADFAAKQLVALSTQIAEVTHAQRSHPERAPVTFHNVLCGAAGAKTTLHHNFGRNADFIVTMWKGGATVAGHSLVCDEFDAAGTVVTDENKISFRSYVTGTANIRVYPRG